MPESAAPPKFPGPIVEVAGRLAKHGCMTGEKEGAAEAGKSATVPAAAAEPAAETRLCRGMGALGLFHPPVPANGPFQPS